MYTTEIKQHGQEESEWRTAMNITPATTFAAVQQQIMQYAHKSHWRILSEGTVVATWTPETGWRYWRSAEEIIHWCNYADWPLYKEFRVYMRQYPCRKNQDFYLVTDMPDRDDFISNYALYSDHANTYLDSIGACLPEGALSPGKSDQEPTAEEIVAWMKTFKNDYPSSTEVILGLWWDWDNLNLKHSNGKYGLHTASSLFGDGIQWTHRQIRINHEYYKAIIDLLKKHNITIPRITKKESVMSARKAIADLTKNEIGKLEIKASTDERVVINAECRVNNKIWTRADWEALDAAVRWAGGWDDTKEETKRTFTPEV